MESLEFDNNPIPIAKTSQEVCIKIENVSRKLIYGRHFEGTEKIYSRISRQSIEAVKAHFRDEMTKADWKLMIKLKKVFEII